MGVLIEHGKGYERALTFCENDKEFFANEYDKYVRRPYISLEFALAKILPVNKKIDFYLNIHLRKSETLGIEAVFWAKPHVGTEKEQSERLEFLVIKTI